MTDLIGWFQEQWNSSLIIRAAAGVLGIAAAASLGILDFLHSLLGFAFVVGMGLLELLASGTIIRILEFVFGLIEHVDIIFALIEVFVIGLCLPYIDDPLLFIREWVGYHIRIAQLFGQLFASVVNQVTQLAGTIAALK